MITDSQTVNEIEMRCSMSRMSRMSFYQTEDENYAAFIARLIEAGWSKDEAILEWQRIQEGDGD